MDLHTAIVKSEEVGLKCEPINQGELIKIGMKIREKELEESIALLYSDQSLEEKINWEEINDEPPITRFVRSCETTLGKTAKSGYWWTVGIWSFFSWIGLKIASEIKD